MSQPTHVLHTYRPENLPRSYFASPLFGYGALLVVVIWVASLVFDVAVFDLAISNTSTSWWMAPVIGVAVVGPLTVSAWRRSRRTRADLTTTSVVVDGGGRRQPLTIARDRIASASWMTDFRRGGFHQPMLIFFDAGGVALFTLVGKAWSDLAWRHLLIALGSPRLDVVTQPLHRRDFLARYPHAIGPEQQRKIRRTRLILGIAWLIIAASLTLVIIEARR